MRQAALARTREEPAVRRDQIIEEATRLVGRRGYYGLKIQEVAKRCGLSNAGLLYHFPSKEHLMAAVLQEFDRRVTEVIAPLVERATQRISRTEKAREATADVLRLIVERGIAQPELVRLSNVLQAESLDPGHPAHLPLRTRDTKILDLLTKLTMPYFADPRSAARRLLALMDGLGQQWLRAGQSFDILDEWARAIEVFLPALTPPRNLVRLKIAREKNG